MPLCGGTSAAGASDLVPNSRYVHQDKGTKNQIIYFKPDGDAPHLPRDSNS